MRNCALSAARTLTALLLISLNVAPVAEGREFRAKALCSIRSFWPAGLVEARSDAQFLRQPLYAGNNDSEFLRDMQGAIAATRKEMRDRPRQSFSQWWVRNRIEEIGNIRAETGGRRHAIRMPTKVEDQSFQNMIFETKMRDPEDTFNNHWGHYHDVVAKNNRHSPFFKRARGVAKRHKAKKPEIEIDGQTFRLSTVDKYGQSSGTYFYVNHPTYPEMEKMRTVAYQKIGYAMNIAADDEARALDEIAQAYMLLMHAPPRINGGPSIVETLIEAILREKFNKSLPKNKIREPFWEVMYWDHEKKGPFLWKDFIANYR